MLRLTGITKTYKTGDFVQTALDGVSISFRDNEFVAILGASGSGKTTLLNIIGGLDQYDDGELLIEGRSTRKYRDRDWDTYRNNRVGFVFQSYNLIPRQTVLANVELALTLSGVSRSERRRRAQQALDEVGLLEHQHKKPNQLSGGQMQRVAIARALINDPEIVLADEPTGALDTATADQIMALLTKIGADRLVVMVTHNAELAEQHATRIVNLRDGRVISDTAPTETSSAQASGGVQNQRQTRRTRMGFLTAIALSFSNLMTKKGRTAMTAFAGSIGIIGIAAILALANGVNSYIRGVEEDTLSVYPISIQSHGFDMTALLSASTDIMEDAASPSPAAGEAREIQMLNRLFAAIGSNDLGALKTFLDGDSRLDPYVNSVNYSYAITPQIFNADSDSGVRQVNPDTTLARLGLGPAPESQDLMPAFMATDLFAELISDAWLIREQYDVVAGSWPDAADEAMIVLTPSSGISDFVLYTLGVRDPGELEEMVTAVEQGERVETPGDTRTIPYDELLDVAFKVVPAAQFYDYDSDYDVWTDKRTDEPFLADLVADGLDLRISGIVRPRPDATATALNPGIYYTPALTEELVLAAADSEIVAAQLDDPTTDVFTGRPFTEGDGEEPELDLSEFITVDEEAIAQAFSIDESQLNLDFSGFNIGMPDVQFDPALLPALDLEEVLAGLDFELDEDAAEQAAGEFFEAYLEFADEQGADPFDVEEVLPQFLATEEGQERLGALENLAEGVQESAASQLETVFSDYLTRALTIYSAEVSDQVSRVLEAQISAAIDSSFDQLIRQMPDAVRVDEDQLLEAFEADVDVDELSELILALAMQDNTLSSNLRKLGYADFDDPAMIDIYPKSFEGKNEVIAVLDQYNDDRKEAGEEDKVITYTDFVGALMSSVTEILNVITYVLIAFVSISLIVSSIMIGVITYVSVLERIKEIGILRAIGASKRDVRLVFNAETLIIGLIAGLLGIGATYLLTVPANAIVSARFDIEKVAQLPTIAAVILVAISMTLTLLAGLIPAASGARKDPVAALRSE